MSRADARGARGGILYVESDAELGLVVKDRLSSQGYTVDIAGSSQAGLAAFDEARHDLVAVDHDPQGCNGFGLLEALVAQGVRTPVGIVISEDRRERLRSLLRSVDELVTPGALSCRRVSQMPASVLPPLVAAQLREMTRSVLAGCAPDQFDFAIRSGGAASSYTVRVLPLRDFLGTCTGVLVVVRAVAEVGNVERELQQARRKLDEANRARSRMVAGMSHQLRTPLTAIIGFSEILRYEYFGPINENQKQRLDIVLRCSEQMLDLINDLLDISALEAGTTRLASGPLNLHTLVSRTVERLAGPAAHHRVSLDYRQPESTDDLIVSGDEKSLTQVVFNLLSNAIRFTPEGGAVSVNVSRAAECVAVAVRDTGVGIPPGEQDLIFEPFYQARPPQPSAPQGSGLGLSLAKRLVELHGGRIWADSEGEGRGSVFTFTLPTGHPLSASRGRGKGGDSDLHR